MAENNNIIDESGGSNGNGSTPISSSTNSIPVDKKRKTMKSRSAAWEHFEKYTDSDGASRAKCNYCGSNYAADSTSNGTSSLNTHLKKCKKNPHNMETTQAKIGFQQISKDQKNQVTMSIWKFDQELSRKALAKMIIVDELPFSFVEGEGFRYFVTVTQPQFRISSRATVTRDCFELFLEEKQKLKHFFKGSNQRVCLTNVRNLSIFIRQAVKYIRQSPMRLKNFKDCCEIKKIKSKKALCLDVVTRWNSTYLMLKAAQEFENAFVSYADHDSGLLDYLLSYVCEDGKVAGALTSDDWENIRNMEKFLESFFNLTLRVSGSLYVTSNVHFHEIGELSCVLKILTENDDFNLRMMAKRMKAKFYKYWGAPEKMNKVIFIACVLDPRFKFDYVAFVF